MRRRLAVLMIILAATLVIAGCPGNQPGDSSQNSPSRNATTTQNPQAVPENSTRMNPVAPPQSDLPSARIPAAAAPVVPVQLTEYEIQFPETLAAGRQTLQITNAGKQNHNFAIEGNGLGTKLSSDLMRGDSAQLNVDLKPGTYTVFCPVDGHRGKGMHRTVLVR